MFTHSRVLSFRVIGPLIFINSILVRGKKPKSLLLFINFLLVTKAHLTSVGKCKIIVKAVIDGITKILGSMDYEVVETK